MWVSGCVQGCTKVILYLRNTYNILTGVLQLAHTTSAAPFEKEEEQHKNKLQ